MSGNYARILGWCTEKKQGIRFVEYGIYKFRLEVTCNVWHSVGDLCSGWALAQYLPNKVYGGNLAPCLGLLCNSG